jgi:P27 family predicted phage terminase small subunit
VPFERDGAHAELREGRPARKVDFFQAGGLRDRFAVVFSRGRKIRPFSWAEGFFRVSRPRKLDSRRQRGSRTPAIGIVADRPKETPAPPAGLLKATREQWVEFWKSPAANIVELGSDLPALHRLFQLYDERTRAIRACSKKPMVEGSKGQPVRNPLSKVVTECDGAIRVLEDRFGLTPKARLQLGITPGKGPKSIDDLNRMLNETDDDDRDEDPRLAAI